MRLLLSTAALLTVALFAIATNWALDHYREPPVVDRSSEDPRFTVKHTAYLAHRAVGHFHALNTNEQRTLRAEVLASMSTLDQWVQRVARPANLLCLGERHEDAVRAFIADEIMSRLNFQVLMLETSRDQLHELIVRFDENKPARMLGASLDAILRAALSRRPPARVLAIDEPHDLREREAVEELAAMVSELQLDRESALVNRIRAQWQPGKQHIILFGALHCRATDTWMMGKLVSEEQRINQADVNTTVVLARHVEGSAQMLMFLLEEMGLATEVVVIPRTSLFSRLIQQWLPPVAEAIADYDSAIIFSAPAAAR